METIKKITQPIKKCKQCKMFSSPRNPNKCPVCGQDYVFKEIPVPYQFWTSGHNDRWFGINHFWWGAKTLSHNNNGKKHDAFYFDMNAGKVDITIHYEDQEPEYSIETYNDVPTALRRLADLIEELDKER